MVWGFFGGGGKEEREGEGEGEGDGGKEWWSGGEKSRLRGGFFR